MDDFYNICSSLNESVLSSYGICISIVGNVRYTVRGCTNIDSSVDETGFLLFIIDKCLAIHCGPKTLSVVLCANCTDWRWEAHHFTHEWLLIIFISVNSFNKPMTVTHLCIARSSSFALISLVTCHFSWMQFSFEMINETNINWRWASVLLARIYFHVNGSATAHFYKFRSCAGSTERKIKAKMN